MLDMHLLEGSSGSTFHPWLEYGLMFAMGRVLIPRPPTGPDFEAGIYAVAQRTAQEQCKLPPPQFAHFQGQHRILFGPIETAASRGSRSVAPQRAGTV